MMAHWKSGRHAW